MIKFIILLCLCLSGCADNPFRQEVEAQLREDNIRQAVTTLGDRPAINISASKDRVKDAIQTVLTQKGIPIESVTDYQILSGWIPSRTGIPLVKEQMRFFIESAADKVTISASCVQQISVL